MAEYRLIPGSIQDVFGNLRTKVQIFGGGFGNGKTAAAVVQKALRVARDYPGANILIARSTYPKLNDTIRKEFLKWCPPNWIKSFPLSKNSDNTCTLTNGTTINFRYIAQQGKAAAEGEMTTSNLLSATYDLVIVDQLEDPEISKKDFDDLFGRLRGSAKYIGNDPTMPSTGPRWLVACLNPTRNWCYRFLIAPLIKYQKTGYIDENLLVRRYPRDHVNAGQPILNSEGKPELLIGMVEGSTYTNSHNLAPDFIEGLESLYRGQSRDRFLYGEWAAYEGLVHPDFSEVTHLISQSQMANYVDQMLNVGTFPRWFEGYDFGIVVPSCYLLAFADRYNNIFVCDGFYKPESEFRIGDQQKRIHEIRREWGVEDDVVTWADPATFKRTAVSRNTAAKTVKQLFGEGDYGVNFRRAENEVMSGLTKVNMYLGVRENHRHPVTKVMGAPHIFFANELQFIIDEFTAYYWKQDTNGSRVDEPIDKNDHAMNTIKYMLAKEPDLATRVPRLPSRTHLTQWSEGPTVQRDTRAHRYG
ncbi:MAG: terminase family protein [Gammaproteobacteria bacterium]|uniref:Putative terminase n=1 Tax=viral metagenome TaxID=1070528 RepID=A0A6H1ZAS9_9ZZZZ|nr:terminase family protein [Gammaproteobacteria bacterium]